MCGGTCCFAVTLPFVKRGRPWKSPASVGAARSPSSSAKPFFLPCAMTSERLGDAFGAAGAAGATGGFGRDRDARRARGARPREERDAAADGERAGHLCGALRRRRNACSGASGCAVEDGRSADPRVAHVSVVRSRFGIRMTRGVARGTRRFLHV